MKRIRDSLPLNLNEVKIMEIYFDHAATTYMRSEVVDVMQKYFSEEYGNPSSFHQKGLVAKTALKEARRKVADIIMAKKPSEIVFTGSGTESCNLAIKGVAKLKGRHMITSKIEHHAVLDSCKYLEKYEDFEITYIDVDKDGIVKLNELKKAIRKDTILISIMYANNEVGTVQPIKEISKIAKEHSVLFHTDACQAGGALDINVQNLGVDLMTINSSKIYGPKGVGMLYVREGINLVPLIHGGGQENNLRSGTENIAGIVAFAKALELAQMEREEENKRLCYLRDHLVERITKEIPDTWLNGHHAKRLPNNANITFLNIEGESIILQLNEYGIYVSSGSACTSKTLEPSYVLTAMSVPHEVAHGSIRFSLGKRNTKDDIDSLMEVLPVIVGKLRKLSPVKLKVEEVKK